MRTLILGCGYLGLRVGRLLIEQGDTVIGAVRTSRITDELQANGIVPVQVDVTDPSSLRLLPAADRVLYAVAFDPSAGKSLRDVVVGGLHATIARLVGRCGRFVFISSTGVYGQQDGSWVDEASPTEPVSESGRAYIEAEKLVGAAIRNRGLDAVILRLAGLYGPGRIMKQAAITRGEPIPTDPDHWLNLIHVEDAARAVVATWEAPKPSRLYVVSDGHPVTRREFYETMAGVLGAPAPRFVTPVPSVSQSRRDLTSKRIRSDRIVAEMGLEWKTPSLATGLPAALNGGSPSSANANAPVGE